jgi:hypothetical protein
MPVFWGKTVAAAMSAKLERLHEAERVLIELAFQQQQQQQSNPSSSTTVTTFIPPKIHSFDTYIPMSSINNESDKVMNHCLVRSITSQKMNETNDALDSYIIHGVAVTAQSDSNQTIPRCDKPLVLLHGYST